MWDYRPPGFPDEPSSFRNHRLVIAEEDGSEWVSARNWRLARKNGSTAGLPYAAGSPVDPPALQSRTGSGLHP